MSNRHAASAPGAPATEKARDVGRDCIFVKDWVIDCNIGVYAEEKGVTQKVRITIDAYLAQDLRAANDDMDTVPSYTDIIDAVNERTAEGHINLIETLAEDVAARVLENTRIDAIRIRIEKLERGPVRGVEIYRARAGAVR
ncbi:dihydroneopterin aldolase [Hyphomicrobium sp.]|uniref:dihydroneopterin aldolase n=1 Tax=Hyphomicrobium sp. TaxID=82 RepID=UPI002C8ACEFB|nr:dihydroneopterin aldolase [Hyphomicrobium sp.]HRN88410.1 dihydroneopterin aldolase [Hyphomicrobium sp.]HRQ27779.1 dihydroneopterin aldolase [Hyphomicrobium sp.]